MFPYREQEKCLARGPFLLFDCTPFWEVRGLSYFRQRPKASSMLPVRSPSIFSRMPRSSEAIGAIAATPAKAQAELTNPEETLVGTGTIAPLGPLWRPDLRPCRRNELSAGIDALSSGIAHNVPLQLSAKGSELRQIIMPENDVVRVLVDGDVGVCFAFLAANFNVSHG